MSTPDFLVETQQDYLTRLADAARSGKFGQAILGTMIINAPPGSLENDVLTSLSGHDENAVVQVRYDWRYTESMSLVGNRNVRRNYPFLRPADIQRRDIAAAEIDQTLTTFADILVGVRPRFSDSGTNAKWLRRVASHHLLQRLGVVHAKYAVIDEAATILTGNLVPSTMNNLALTINHPAASRFISGATMTAGLSRSGNLREPLSDKTSLILDYGNYGHPAQLPLIHQLAEAMIDPKCETTTSGGELPKRRPETIYLLSQYVPDGKLLRALKRAEQEYETEVIIPLQPADDYRLRALGYSALYANFRRKVANHDQIITPHRQQPSHIKCLVAEYDDGTKSMIFGTDNFGTTVHKFARNTELAIHIDHAEPGETGYKMIEAVLDKLHEMGEIAR